MQFTTLLFLPLFIAASYLLILFVRTNNWQSPGKRVAVALSFILVNNYGWALVTRMLKDLAFITPTPLTALLFQIPGILAMIYIYATLRRGQIHKI